MGNKTIIYSIFGGVVLMILGGVFFISVAIAEMKQITIEDASDHTKLVKTINKLIDRTNQDKADDKADKKEMKEFTTYIYKCEDKMIKKMVNKGWINTHSEVEP